MAKFDLDGLSCDLRVSAIPHLFLQKIGAGPMRVLPEHIRYYTKHCPFFKQK